MKDYLGYEIRGIKRVLDEISVDGFLNHLKNNYSDFNNTEVYSEAVYKRCRQAVGYIANKLIKRKSQYAYNVYVCTGRVNDIWHCWIYYNDYYIDLTYAQFDKSFPEMLVIKASKAKKLGILSSDKEYPLFKWIDKEYRDDE